ncbi:ABC transporter, ATP-binding protein [Vibrio sp. AND4]|nr:ABC transporter, ATP-binding protein [Vibrio sp. AND4]
MSNNDLVTVNNLTFSRSKRKIFDGIDLHVPKGKVTAIMGPSGIGKTTLLRSLRSDIPEQGEIWFDGDNIQACHAKSCITHAKK